MKLLRQHAESGKPLYLAAEAADIDIQTTGARRDEATLPASHLARFLTSAPDGRPYKQLRIHGASIQGALDLSQSKGVVAVNFEDCHFTDAIDLQEASFPAVSFTKCRIQRGLTARSLRVEGSLSIVKCTVKRFVNIDYADIGGFACLDGTKIVDPDGSVGLTADFARIGGSLSCRPLVDDDSLYRFESDCGIELIGAHIGGQLLLDGARVSAAAGRYAMSADGVRIVGDLFARPFVGPDGVARFECEGGFRMLGAHVGGQVNLGAARLTASYDGHSLGLDRATIQGGLFCLPVVRSGHAFRFEATGAVWLLGAQIGGQVTLSGAKLKASEDGPAFSCDGTSIAGDLFCAYWAFGGHRFRFECEGECRLLGAEVGGQVAFTGAKLEGPATRAAFNADSAVFRGGLFCSTASDGPEIVRFECSGEFKLLGASVLGQSTFNGAKLVASESGHAFSADRSIFRYGLFCDSVQSESQTCLFECDGEFRLPGAQIDGQVSFSDAKLTARDGGVALDFRGTRMDYELLMPPGCQVSGRVELTDATVARLIDNPAVWADNDYELSGFKYQRIGPPDRLKSRSAARNNDVKSRIRWLRGNKSGYQPGIYNQLAQSYREEGDPADGRNVLYEKNVSRHQQLGFKSVSEGLWKSWSLLERLLIGYGYRNSRVLGWMIATYLVALFVFALHESDFTSAVSSAVPSVEVGEKMSRTESQSNALSFDPALYAADAMLPFARLGYREDWRSEGEIQYFVLLLSLLGWVYATAALAGLSGIVRRRE